MLRHAERRHCSPRRPSSARDIGPFVESEGIAGEDPEEQQLGEGCPHCNHCSGEDEVVEGDFQEFQDYDEF
uniref:Uncharacterized protein n=2 Tax=Zea mays TaxID=4577 RepID=B6SH01_MAIZE|nr:hypothetical protein [Zea mays]